MVSCSEPKRATAKGSSCSAGDVKEAHVSAYVHPSGARMDPRDVARTAHEVSAHPPLSCCLLELGCCWGGGQGGGAPDPSHSTWRSGVGVGSKRLELFLPGGRLHADSAASPYAPAGSCPKSKSSRENVFGSVLTNAPYATVQDGPRPNGRHPSLL